jgi:hypothetical protein
MTSLTRLFTSTLLGLSMLGGTVQVVSATELSVSEEAFVQEVTVTRVDVYPNGTTVIYYSNGVKSIIPPPS